MDCRLPLKFDIQVAPCTAIWLVHLIITMIKWIRTSRLSIKNSLSLDPTH